MRILVRLFKKVKRAREIALVLGCITQVLHAEDVRVLVSNVPGADAYYPAVSSGYLIRPAPHMDINIIWDPILQKFSGGFRTDDEFINGVKQPPTQFTPEGAIVYVPSSTKSEVIPEDPPFFGAPGNEVWIIPLSSEGCGEVFAPYIGLASYGVPHDNTFTPALPYVGGATLYKVNNRVWYQGKLYKAITDTSGNLPTDTTYWSELSATAQGRIWWAIESVENLTNLAANECFAYNNNLDVILSSNSEYPQLGLEQLVMGHSHLHLLFKAKGVYRVTFRIRGTLRTNGQEVSSPVSVYFGVETAQIPTQTPATGYDAWRLATFSPQQANDPAVSGLDKDPDGDGAHNLLEYALGGDPTVADHSHRPEIRTETVAGQDYFAIRFRRRVGDTSLTVLAESTSDLLSASWVEAVQVGSATPVGTDYEEVTYRATIAKADAAKQFMRVRVLKE